MKEHVEELFDLHNALITALWELWKGQQATHKAIDAVKYSRTSVVSLTQVAAIVAVDAQMELESFINTCEANYREAYEKAPKFG